MACQPTTLGQKYASTYLTTDNSPRFDFAAAILRADNPINAYDRQGLLNTSQRLTRSLNNVNLRNFPFLDSRNQQSPILYPEIGDFLSQAGYDLETVDGILTDFEVYLSGINPDTGVPVLLPIPDNPNIVTNIPDVVGPPPGGNPIIEDIAQSTFDGSVPPDYENLLGQLEGYYNDNIANTISGGFCGAFANPFNQILKAVAAISVVQSLFDLLSGFSLDDLFNQLDTLKDKLLSIVDSLVQEQLQRAMNMVQSFSNQIQAFGRNAMMILQSVQRRVNDVIGFFEDFSMETLKEEIGRFIDQAAAQFEELTPEAIALLLFRFCQFAELIQAFLRRPVDTLINYTQGISSEYNLIQGISSVETTRAVAAGAVRLSPSGIQDGRQRMAAQVQGESRAAGPQTNPDVPEGRAFVRDGYLTPEENNLLQNMTDAGIPGRFRFSAGVTQMHVRRGRVSDAGPGDGWRRVDQDVWARMIIIAREMGTEFSITSAYRSPEYNQRLRNAGIAAARNSFHMSGMALDVSMAGKSDTQIRTFIQLASQVGFNGMRYYSGSNFVHVDTRSSPVAFGSSGRFQPYMDAHVRGDFRTGGVAYEPGRVAPLASESSPQGLPADPTVTGPQ